jgi:hypothetical protein
MAGERDEEQERPEAIEEAERLPRESVPGDDRPDGRE